MYRVLVFAPFYPPAYLGGGPIRTISALAQGAPVDYLPFVITSDTDLGQKNPLPVPSGDWTKHEGISTFYFPTGKYASIVKAFVAGKNTRPHLVYLSSFFNIKFSLLPQLLSRIGFFGKSKLVIAPRGELGPAALAIKPFRKRGLIWIYRLLGFDRQVIWHASSTREADHIHCVLGPDAKVLIRENDSCLPTRSVPPKAKNRPQTLLQAAFVGRICVVKGLRELIEALADVKTGLNFDIYGPHEDDEYTDLCRHAALNLPSHIKVTFQGAIEHDKVRSVLGEYDVMLFPTHGENFGHVIAESLSASCPVMCADVTPWTSILAAGGGHVVPENSRDSWAREIQSYAEMSPEERLEGRFRAGRAFEQWRQSSPDRHIFELVGEHIAS